MGFAEWNTGLKSIDWGVSTEGYEFQKCSAQKLGEPLRIYGAFISPDKGYGENAVLIMDGYLLDIASRYIDAVKKIQNSPELIEQIKAGKAGVKITTFESKKYKKTGYDVEFIDL